MEQWRIDNRRDKRPAHNYTLEDFGLNSSKITRSSAIIAANSSSLVCSYRSNIGASEPIERTEASVVRSTECTRTRHIEMAASSTLVERYTAEFCQTRFIVTHEWGDVEHAQLRKSSRHLFEDSIDGSGSS
jgi:hypothetical protein